ncbi:alpha-1,6-mannosylglycoprotein 6-beta-N-acetylglucosaminyltransferase A-like isoform X3 [Dysidea avara]|uniref:alpha-1,6-mannosylglycoprotein 6-beta-N-acetylglucosaminyltransferase A-like isoform X3 n=1 Tax=Dysidea avara TaxID=196820 RepID=UPI00333216F8
MNYKRCFVILSMSSLVVISLGLVVWYFSLDRLRSQLLPLRRGQLLVEDHDQLPLILKMSPPPKQLILQSSQNTPATTPSNTVNKDTTRTTTTTSDSSKTSTTTTSTTSKATTSTVTTSHVTVENMKNLYDSHMIVSQGIKLKWIRNRMMAMADSWESAAHNLSHYRPFLFLKKKTILLVPGLVIDRYCMNCLFAENAFKGGPLGELVQWTDLIVSLFMLGHKITIVTTPTMLQEAAHGPKFDIIFSDYLGLEGLKQTGLFNRYQCSVRVLDTFGSEASEVFSTSDYKAPNTNPYFSQWKFTNMKQFWSLYPHTPDNSFLGFAMEKPVQEQNVVKENRALIYGKQENYIMGKEKYLEAIAEKLQLHSTFTTNSNRIPNTKIVNHGIVDHSTLSSLLQGSKLFIGLGFPYEGPGALEALANGCPFIQPKYKPPRGKSNEKFFRNKPTNRMLTSQSPYLEDFVEEPYVYTVDAEDLSAVRKVVDTVIRKGDVPPYVPYEFTQQGLMDRIGTYLLYQDFCKGESLLHDNVNSVASSHQQDHTPDKAIDDKMETCYQSEEAKTSWWEVDLGSEQFIREINIKIKGQGLVNTNSLMVYLRDSDGFNRTNRLMLEGGSSLSWTDVEIMARHVHIQSDSTSWSSQLTLCSVAIFGSSSFWPKPSLMKVIQSRSDESCKAACADHHMMCEYSYFPLINTFKVHECVPSLPQVS